MSSILLALSLLQTLTLSGTVWRSVGKPAANAEVKAVSPAGTFQTTSDQDGNFTFRLDKAGTFEIRASLDGLRSQPSTIVVGQDTGGVGIFLPPPPRPLVGSVKVDGGKPLPTPRPKLVVHYASGNVAYRCDISDIGLFSCQHPAEFTVSLEGLPSTYFVKSVELIANQCDVTTDIGALMQVLGVLSCRQPSGSRVPGEHTPESNSRKSITLVDGDLTKTPINVSADFSASLVISLGLRE